MKSLVRVFCLVLPNVARAFLAGCFFFFPITSQTQTKGAVDATIVGETPYVYQNPDFDSPVLAELQRGRVYRISVGKKEGFHKILWTKGKTGWIADSEIRIGRKDLTKEKEARSEVEAQKIEKARRSTDLPLELVRHRGLSFEQVMYTEKTMGKERTTALSAYGLRFTGVDTLFSGPFPVDSTLLLAPSVPNYYAKTTGNSASGFVLWGHFQFMTPIHKSKNLQIYYGLGPVMRFSHFELNIGSGGTRQKYVAEDLALGAAISLGGIYRWRSFALRPDLKYFWEKNKYISLGMTFQSAF